MQAFEGRFLRVSLERHTLPDGRQEEFEIVRHPGGAAVLPVLEDGRLLLIRQYRPAVAESILELPAGKLDPGELPSDCAARELEEETGYRAGHLEPLGRMWTAVGFCDELLHLFVASDLVPGQRRLEPNEFITLAPLPPDEALAALRRGEIRDAKTQLALLLYLERLRSPEA